MKTWYYIPASQAKDLKKLCDKTKKNIEGFAYTIGQPYKKLFNTGNDIIGWWKEWFTICDFHIEMPDINDWAMVVSYEQGMMFVSDMTKKLELANPLHGLEYDKCDVCGRRIKNSSVIRNKVTGEELQVGCECLGKFGLKGMEPMRKFYLKLHVDFAIAYGDSDYGDVEHCPSWARNFDKLVGEKSIEKAAMLKAAKMVYDADGGVYYRGHATTDKIQKKINFNESLEVSEEYVSKVCEYTLANPAISDFGIEMSRVAKNFYCKNDDALYAFFMVKGYERYLESLTQKTLEVGTQVHITGYVMGQTKTESYYGDVYTYEIKTNAGYTVYKTGVIPVTIEGGKRRTTFYTTVKFVSKYGKMYLDRALKNPKKGVQYMEI